MRLIRYLAIGFGAIVVNAIIALLLALLVGTLVDVSRTFNEQLVQWRATGIFPYPSWMLIAFPRLHAWPPAAEITYHVCQTAIWAANGYFLRRFFLPLRPTTMVWVPFLVHLVLLDPFQIVVGTLAFYFTARGRSAAASQVAR